MHQRANARADQVSADLRLYQEVGALGHLVPRRYAYLADDMGIGKTVQACVAVANLDILVPRALVICPSVARDVWADHWPLWGTGTAPLVMRKLSDPVPPAAVAGGCLVIVSYDYARENFQALAGYAWDVLILDEAHMAKSHAAQRTRAIFGSNPRGIARAARRVWWLSGTPIENHVGEIWLPLYFTGKTRMSHAEFVLKFCDGYEYHGEFRVTGVKLAALPELRKLLKDSGLFLRRSRAQVFPQLPPRPVTSLVVEAQLPTLMELDAAFPDLDEPARKTRLRLEAELVSHAEAEHSGLNNVSLAILQGIAQSVSTLRRYNGMLKVAPASELIKQELESGQLRKIAVFYVHDGVGAALMRRLKKYRPVQISGATSDAARKLNIAAFNADPTCRVFIGQLKACGTGISLTDCADVLAVETGWDPASLAQALHRVRKPPGEKTPIFSRVMTLDDPLDRAVSSIIARKSREIELTWEEPST